MPWVIRAGLASQVMETLTIGPFLVAYALTLDAGNVVIGFLAAIPFLTQFLQLPAVILIEKVRKRRLISFVFAALSRPMVLVMALAAFMPEPFWALTFLIIGLTFRYSLGAVVACGWNSWMRDIIPEKRMGRFFAQRQKLMTILGVVISLLGALLIDNWGEWQPEGRLIAYPVLLVIAFFAGVYSTYCLRKIPEPPMSEAAAINLYDRLTLPFRDRNFRRLIMFLAPWNFAVNLAAPFFTVYLFERLDLSLTTVTLLMIISQTANVLMIRRWGVIADLFSNKSVLRVCAPLFIICIFAWTFTAFPEKHALTIPLLVVVHIFTGIATAGVTLSTSTISLKLAPAGEAASYMAVTSLINSSAAGIAPIIGGLTIDFFNNQALFMLLQWSGGEAGPVAEILNLRQWDFFFMFATLIGVYSIRRLALVEEAGEVEKRIVIDELIISMRQSVKNLSSIAGLRMLTEFPLIMLRRRRRRRLK